MDCSKSSILVKYLTTVVILDEFSKGFLIGLD